jgi:lipopolysaccharide O-acetyltransferase
MRFMARNLASAYWNARHARDKLFTLCVRGGFVSLGARTLLELPIRLGGVESIAIGSGVFVGANSWLQAHDPEAGLTRLEIGDGTSITGNCVLSAAERVRLGRKVLLARNVYISDHVHSYMDPTRAVMDQGIERVAAVEIGDGAWLAQNVVVAPGVRVGRGAVVGANSVVRSDIPDFALAAGAPARVIRRFASTDETSPPEIDTLG